MGGQKDRTKKKRREQMILGLQKGKKQLQLGIILKHFTSIELEILQTLCTASIIIIHSQAKVLPQSWQVSVWKRL